MSSSTPTGPLFEYPNKQRIETLVQAIRDGKITFQEDNALGFLYEDLSAPEVKQMEENSPDDFECIAALWRLYQEEKLRHEGSS